MNSRGKYDFPLDVDNPNSLNKIIRQIQPGSKVLEFGPANGRMTQYLRDELECKVYIVEIDADAAKDATAYAEDCIVDDIENLQWCEKWAGVGFDYVTFADVLEHLRNPRRIMENIARVLSPDGRVLISVPNVAHNALLINLYNDQFRYTSVGLLDNTHVHLFAQNDLEEMCASTGWTIVVKDAVYSAVGQNEVAANYEDIPAEMRDALCARRNGDVYQYVYTLISSSWVQEHDVPVENHLLDCSGGYILRCIITDADGEHTVDYKYTNTAPSSVKINLTEYHMLKKVFCAFLDISGFAHINGTAVLGDGTAKQINISQYSGEVYRYNDQYYLISTSSPNICFTGEALENCNVIRLGFEFIFSNLPASSILALQEMVCAYQNIDEQNAQLRRSFDELPSVLLSHQQTLQNSYVSALSQSQDKLNKSIESVEQIHHRIDELQDINNTTQKTVSSIQNSHVAMQNTVALTHDAIISMQDTIAEMQRTIIRMQGSIDHISTEFNTYRKEIEDKHQEIIRATSSIDGLYASVENAQHTANDLLYVSQHADWYKRAMREINNGPSGIARINLSIHRALGAISNQLYRMAKKSPSLYKGMQGGYEVLSRISPSMRNRLDHVVWNSKQEVDGISVSDAGDVDHRVEQCDLPIKQDNPLVTVIVPNYNHSAYLRQRLDSIYGQTYSNIEVILLDDCSTDDSRSILEEYAQRYSDKTICAYNETNVGRANLQWNKGLTMAKGKYIWIAESDDWCELNFLETLVPLLDQQSVMIAFARSVFMTDGKKTWSTEEYLHDLPLKWDRPFTMSAYDAVHKGFAIKNIIPNASSAVFRNIGPIPDEVMDIWKNIRLCGDWIFYLYLIKGGAFSYTNQTTNYYRIHKASTSLNVQKTASYYQESETVSCYIAHNYKIDPAVFEQTLKTLQQHYLENGFGSDPEDVCQWYSLSKIRQVAANRIPNVMICNFAMKIGGGEILPIHLANALRKKGCAITFVDCRMEDYDEDVRQMLDPGVPFVELRTPLELQTAAKLYGAEVVHSHHGSVDKLVSELLQNKGIKQIITLHGMYEAIDKRDLVDLLQHVTVTCNTFAYIADKNLIPFKEYGYFDKCHFVKIGNGLVSGCPNPIDRNKLNIPKDAFVLCLVSRARYDKGWLEACDAVIRANTESERAIHLILVGDGEAYAEVASIDSQYIHAVGAKGNPRAYFATADMGFLPSRFAGESFPLVVIESLMCGRPVLASNIGEIPNQITLDDGRTAGYLFNLDNGKIPVDELSKIIANLAMTPEKVAEMQCCTAEAAAKFDIKNIAEEYIDMYYKCKCSIIGTL